MSRWCSGFVLLALASPTARAGTAFDDTRIGAFDFAANAGSLLSEPIL